MSKVKCISTYLRKIANIIESRIWQDRFPEMGDVYTLESSEEIDAVAGYNSIVGPGELKEYLSKIIQDYKGDMYHADRLASFYSTQPNPKMVISDLYKKIGMINDAEVRKIESYMLQFITTKQKQKQIPQIQQTTPKENPNKLQSYYIVLISLAQHKTGKDINLIKGINALNLNVFVSANATDELKRELAGRAQQPQVAAPAPGPAAPGAPAV